MKKNIAALILFLIVLSVYLTNVNAQPLTETVAYTLENDLVRFSVDNHGRLVELTNKNTGTNYAGGGHLWRLIYQNGISLEEEFNNNNCKAAIEQKDNTMTLIFDETSNADLAFQITITMVLNGDDLNFDMLLENSDKEHTIRECQFPFIKNINFGKDHGLFLSEIAGVHFDDIEREINSKHTQYIGLENKEIQRSLLYPGRAAMNYYMIASDVEGLYIGSHDTTFQVTNHYLSKFPQGGMNCAMIKYPFLAPGEKVSINGGVLSPYSGSWHVAAQKYRKWADTWYTLNKAPESLQTMTSWHRIILRHQYGKTFYRYDQLCDILEDGKSTGIKTLFLFGWHAGGHDSEYPDYSPDESQGGFAALKENIQKFQAKGGQVILYFNGRLIDVASDFYKEKGHEVCIKRPDGSEHNEFYKFGADGTALRLFGNKSFVTACPSSREWQQVLKGFVDQAIALGCDGVFFDQLGLMPEMCFDPNHGHKVPFIDMMKVNADNLKELRQYVKSKKPDMIFGTEWLSDVTAQYVDFVHNVVPGSKAVTDWQHGEKPKSWEFKEMFYYTFPEVITSDREIRDDTDIERRVNFALMKGLISDVEIYRCRTTIAATPHYREYLTKANALREKYADVILQGLYQDTDHFTIDNPEFFATSFIAGNKLGVMVSQSHLDEATTTLKVPGYKYITHDGLNDFSVKTNSDSITLHVKRHGLVLVLFEKDQ